MGSIGGDLAVLGITNLVQAVAQNPRGGRLTVTREDERKIVQCAPDGLRILEGSRRVSPLGQILVRTRKLTRAQLAEILEEHGRSGIPLGRYVTERGILSREDIDKALQEQAADEICDLFMWTEGRFEFVESGDDAEIEGDGILSSVVLNQGVMYLALESARRLDHLARIRETIPGERLVPVALEIPLGQNEPGLDRETLQEILPFVDGKRSVEQIVEESLYPKFTVLLTLHALAQRGSAKIRDVGASEGPETVVARTFSASPAASPEGATVVLMGEQGQSRLALAMFLGNLGLNVIECPPQENLSRLLARSSAKLILLDADLGTPQGIKLCSLIATAAPVPVIAMTPLGSGGAASNAFTSGARHVIVKPVDSTLLLERIRESLASPS